MWAEGSRGEVVDLCGLDERGDVRDEGEVRWVGEEVVVSVLLARKFDDEDVGDAVLVSLVVTGVWWGGRTTCWPSGLLSRPPVEERM